MCQDVLNSTINFHVTLREETSMTNKASIPKDRLDMLLRDALDNPSHAKSKEALKELGKDRYRIHEHTAKTILHTLQTRGGMTEVAQAGAVIRLLNLAALSRASADYETFYEQQALSGLQHRNGNIREIARKVVDNLPFVYGIDETGKTKFNDFLYRVEALIQKHTPPTPPPGLHSAKPSPYKTLCITWHYMMAKYHLYEQLNYLERMFELDIPPLFDETETAEPEEAYYRLPDWRECIEEYLTPHDRRKISNLFAEREAASLKMMDWALNQVGDNSAYERIVELARGDDSFPLQKELVGIISKHINIFQPGAHDQQMMRAYNKVARAIQSIDNNAVHISDRGLRFSRLLTAAVEEEWYEVDPEPIEITELMRGFSDVHSRLVELHRMGEETLQERVDFLREMDASLVYHDHDRDLLHEALQTAQYIVDWLFMINGRIFTKKPPRQTAAIAWSIVNDTNASAMPAMIATPELARYAGWASSSSLSSARLRISSLLRQHMPDQDILLLTTEYE